MSRRTAGAVVSKRQLNIVVGTFYFYDDAAGRPEQLQLNRIIEVVGRATFNGSHWVVQPKRIGLAHYTGGVFSLGKYEVKEIFQDPWLKSRVSEPTVQCDESSVVRSRA